MNFVQEGSFLKIGAIVVLRRVLACKKCLKSSLIQVMPKSPIERRPRDILLAKDFFTPSRFSGRIGAFEGKSPVLRGFGFWRGGKLSFEFDGFFCEVSCNFIERDFTHLKWRYENL